MNKRCLLLVILVSLLILAACDDSNSDSQLSSGNEFESVKLDNLEVPRELKIMTPEVSTMYQEFYVRWRTILEEYNGGTNLSEAETEKYEEQLALYTEELDEWQEKIIVMDDPEIIGNIFEKMQNSKAVYDDESLEVESVKEGEYYSIEPLYAPNQQGEQNFEEGYIVGMMIFEDDTLYLLGATGDIHAPEAEMIRMEFDYQWFDHQINQ